MSKDLTNAERLATIPSVAFPFLITLNGSADARRSMASHDHAYKLLFSHPRMVRDLVVAFARGRWRSSLDLRSLERCNTHFVSDSLRSRTSDIVWRLRAGEHEDVYLLLEFQSTIEPFMAVRVLTYVGLLYQDLIKTGRISDRQLPPIAPVVLYCGERPWNAPTSLRRMSRTSLTVPVKFRPGVRYQLIDVRRLRLDGCHLKHNLAAALFRIENSRNTLAVRNNVRLLLAALNRSGSPASLRRAFDAWINRIVLARIKGGSIGAFISLEERQKMLSERFDRWERELAARGRREGLRKGLRKGLREGLLLGLRKGRTEQLLALMRARFGSPLPRGVRRRIERATPTQMKRWGEKLMSAASVQDVFEQSK